MTHPKAICEALSADLSRNSNRLAVLMLLIAGNTPPSNSDFSVASSRFACVALSVFFAAGSPNGMFSCTLNFAYSSSYSLSTSWWRCAVCFTETEAPIGTIHFRQTRVSDRSAAPCSAMPAISVLQVCNCTTKSIVVHTQTVGWTAICSTARTYRSDVSTPC